MARKVLESCPSCGGTLEITEVHCLDCDARVQAHFRADDFSGLSEEQGAFLRVFVTSRGNLSEVEKRLGVSYPTVRAKLDEIIARLEAPRPAAESSAAASMAGERPALGRTLGETLRTEIGATVRATLDDVLGPLTAARPAPRDRSRADEEPRDAPDAPDAPEALRRAILDAVARGELSPTDGLERIRQMGGVS